MKSRINTVAINNALATFAVIAATAFGAKASANPQLSAINLVNNSTKAVLQNLSSGTNNISLGFMPASFAIQVLITPDSGVSHMVFTDTYTTPPTLGAPGKQVVYSHTEWVTPWFMCGDYNNCASLSVPGTHLINIEAYDKNNVGIFQTGIYVNVDNNLTPSVDSASFVAFPAGGLALNIAGDAFGNGYAGASGTQQVFLSNSPSCAVACGVVYLSQLNGNLLLGEWQNDFIQFIITNTSALNAVLRANMPAEPSGAQLYLYLFNSRGRVSQTGIPIMKMP